MRMAAAVRFFYVIGSFVSYYIKCSARMYARIIGIMPQAAMLGAAKCAPFAGAIFAAA